MTTSNQPETQRLFIAVELSPEALSALSQLIHGLRASALHGVSFVTASMGFLATGAAPFALELGDVGGFPNLKRTRVLMVGLGGDMQSLNKLASLVEGACESLGFKRETRPFSPHLTVARMRDSASPEDRRNAGKVLTSLPWNSGLPVPIDSFKLIKSTLTPQGSIYETLHAIALPLS